MSLFKRNIILTVGTGFLIGYALQKRLRQHKLYDLKDKVVLIGGGSRGLGLILARQLVQKGAHVAICSRSTKNLLNAEEQLQALNGESDIQIFQADLTEKGQVDRMVDQVIRHFGRLDVLINVAGIMQIGPYEAMGLKEYEDAMRTNFWTALHTIHACVPQFKAQGYGKIVNITSIGGKIAVPHMLPYSASKFALVGFSDGLRTELKRHNILVTTIIPYLMRTGSPRNISVKGNHEAEYAWFKTLAMSPLIAQNAEVAAKKIIRALEQNSSTVTLSGIARIAEVLKEIMPGSFSLILSMMNRLLPKMTDTGYETKMGFECESSLSNNILTPGSKETAMRNNEG
jgi:short-subunit dehydrogenase